MTAETIAVERLADTLALYAAEPDGWRVLTGAGLTLGDLRALLTHVQAAAVTPPRIFGHGDPEPSDVTAVLDELGQVWQRSAGRWRHQFASMPWHLLTNVPGTVYVEVALPEHPDPVPQ